MSVVSVDLARPNAVAMGIGAAALAFALFTMMDTTIKWMSAGYPLHQIILTNALFALVPVLAAVGRTGSWAAFRTRRLGLHLLRGTIAIGGAYGGFFAFSRMPMADTYAILFASPLFITALSALVLKEDVGWRRWTAVLIGFAGVIVMLRPGAGVIGLGALGALAGSFSYSAGVLLVRLMGRQESAVSFVLYTNLMIALGGAALLPTGFVVPGAGDFALMAFAGLLNGTAMLLVVSAFRWAPAAVVAPFQYTQMIWGVLFGYLVWGDLPDLPLFVGGGIVVASGLYILHRETVRRVPRTAPAAATPIQEPAG
ncbi:MAG TPA: DMT family transporter [Alphaproteobacteria bacterium]|nr:DMT family transporter [Alphaproteobacteria bacterium]